MEHGADQPTLPGFEDKTAFQPKSPVEIRPSEERFVSGWLDKIKFAKKKFRKDFKRMNECMQLATHGAMKEWVEDDKYTVPVISRHINLSVAQIYAKNPTTVVERKRRRMYRLWDGRPESVQMALQGAQRGDVRSQALLQEMAQVAVSNDMVDGVADTVHILWNHQVSTQTVPFKKQMKALVRRAKTCSVGYVRLGYQRQLEPMASEDTGLEDSTQQLALAQQLDRQLAENPEGEDDARIETRVAVAKSLARARVVQEGLVFMFPRATRVILDPGTIDLTCLTGCMWVAYEKFLTVDEIERTYGVQIDDGMAEAAGVMQFESDESKQPSALPVYEVWCKRTKSVFVISDFHKGYLREPDAPPVFTEKFFDLYTLVFNDVESEDDLYPPSDVWRMRHMQHEYNRSREGLREHRIAARPYYVATQALEENDGKRLQNHAAHEIIMLKALADGQNVNDVLQAGPVAGIDPNLYEVENIHTDMLRAVGSQEANLGGLSGGTATESSIAESSRMSGLSDNVDDLDELLEEIARDGARILLQEMSKDYVMEIVGPGAVWPDAPQRRTEMSDEIFLTFEAGSSGRPNKAAELSNLERGAPLLTQMPGVQPGPLVRKFARLMELDPDELYAPGTPSIVAMNAAAGTPPPAAPQGDVPAAQAPAGSGGPQQRPAEGPQPAFPTQNGLETLN